jgi:hypothetical protein
MKPFLCFGAITGVSFLSNYNIVVTALVGTIALVLGVHKLYRLFLADRKMSKDDDLDFMP